MKELALQIEHLGKRYRYGSVSMWQGKNNSCSSARHWDAIKNSNAKYAGWAARGSWSRQGTCWANVVSYGMTAR